MRVSPPGWMDRFTPTSTAVVTAWKFLRFTIHRFLEDRCMQAAGVLTYTTLLAIVPLSAVALGAFSAFPVFDQFSGMIQDFIFLNFVPAAGESIRSNLQAFAAKANQLTAVGTGFLFVTAIMMVAAISHALNDIWKTHYRRSVAGRVAVYWAMLTLGPILIGISLAISSYLFSLPFFASQALPGLRRALVGMLPWATSTLAFTLTYTIVPDARVPLRRALLGAGFAAALFEIAKRGFALYVTQFPTYQAIYGALAAIPIFLLWVYVCWLIILLGAEIAYCLDQPDGWSTDGGGTDPDLVLAVRVLGYLNSAMLCGEEVREREIVRAEKNLGRDRLSRLLQDLADSRLIHRTFDGGWALRRDLNDFTLADLLRVRPYAIPSLESVKRTNPVNRALAHYLEAAGRGLDSSLDVPLRDVFKAASVTRSEQLGASDPSAVNGGAARQTLL